MVIIPITNEKKDLENNIENCERKILDLKKDELRDYYLDCSNIIIKLLEEEIKLMNKLLQTQDEKDKAILLGNYSVIYKARFDLTNLVNGCRLSILKENKRVYTFSTLRFNKLYSDYKETTDLDRLLHLCDDLDIKNNVKKKSLSFKEI